MIRTCFWGSSYIAPGKVMLFGGDYGSRAPQYLLQKNGGSEVAIIFVMEYTPARGVQDTKVVTSRTYNNIRDCANCIFIS